MREIKFRQPIGKDVRPTQWYFWGLKDGVYRPPINQCESDQYTGLKDVYGKEIYEGDILVGVPQFGEKTPIVHVIKWHDDIEQSCGSGYAIGFDMDELDYRTVRVVGNIYENKELVEEI